MTTAAEQPYWGDPGYRLALYDDSYHLTAAQVVFVTVVRHTATQVVVARSDGLELRFYRDGGRPVGSRYSHGGLRPLEDDDVQNALAVAVLRLLTTKLEQCGRPKHQNSGKRIKTRVDVLKAMREMRREIALAWDQMGGNRDDLD